MDLVQRLTSETGVDTDIAERALGSIFMTIRLAVNAEQYGQIKAAFPQVEDWLKKGTDVGGGRTGEMLAILDAESLAERLQSAGLAQAQQQAFATVIGSAVREALSPELAAQITSRVPLLAS